MAKSNKKKKLAGAAGLGAVSFGLGKSQHSHVREAKYYRTRAKKTLRFAVKDYSLAGKKYRESKALRKRVGTYYKLDTGRVPPYVRGLRYDARFADIRGDQALDSAKKFKEGARETWGIAKRYTKKANRFKAGKYASLGGAGLLAYSALSRKKRKK